MENLSHSRHPNRSKKVCGNAAAATRSLYDDVYGGPPKFSAAAAKTNLSPRMEDYSEIFGSFQASRASSIPVLDLPAVDESEVVFDVRSSRFDYTEVFGRGYEDLNFAVSYEDLVNGDSSSEAWSPAEFESVSEESDGSSKDQNFANGNRQYQVDGNTEFSISYNQARQMSSEDVTNGVTHVARVHAVPGYSFMVDSASQPKESKMTANSYLDMDTSAEMMKTEKTEKAASVPSNGSLSGHRFEDELRQKKAHGKDGSGNSFLDISKINLRTQPSDLPPPSRPPPMVGGKKGDMSKLISKSNTSPFEGTPGDSSPTFFDVEVDASSSAAVSAAAIRDAMAKAQVKLKSAKELMEKKKEGLQGSYRLGSKKYMKDKVSETDISIAESLRVKDEKLKGATESAGRVEEIDSREEKKMASKREIPGVIYGEALLRPHEKHVEENKESRLSSRFYKAEETSEWKEASEFFELITVDEPKKDCGKVNCLEILRQNEEVHEHMHKAKRVMTSVEAQSRNDMKVKMGKEEDGVNELGEKRKAEFSRHKEHNLRSKEASEMKVHGKNLQPSHEACDEVEKKGIPTVTELSAPNNRVPETEKSVAEKETITQPIPITCNDESIKELTKEIWSHEVAETSNYEVLLGAVGMENDVRGKNFEASATVESGFVNDALAPLDCSVKKTRGGIESKPDATDDSGVFEIENFLFGESLKALGKLQEKSSDNELSHLNNQVKDTTEDEEQVESPSAKGSDSLKQARYSSHECEENEEDFIPVQVLLNQEEQRIDSANVCKERRVPLQCEYAESTKPPQMTIGSCEDVEKVEAAQHVMAEEKQESQNPVQQVNARKAPEIKEEAHRVVGVESDVIARELENQILKKMNEEQERERDREREVKPNNQKLVQQLNASQTTEMGEKKCEVVDAEREKSESKLESKKLRKVEEEKEMERDRENEGKPKIQKSAQPVNASQVNEMKEKTYEEVDAERENRESELKNNNLRKVKEEQERREMESEGKPKNQKSVQQLNVSQVHEIKQETHEVVGSEREKRERGLENQGLRKVEEEQERDMESEGKPNNQNSVQEVNASQVHEMKQKKYEEVDREREKRERELESQRLRAVEEDQGRERDTKREREVNPKSQKSKIISQIIEITEVFDEVGTEQEKRESELEKQRLRKMEEERERERSNEREREVKLKNQKPTEQVKASQTTERKEKISGELETGRIQRERELDNEGLRSVEEERKREEKQKTQKSAQQVKTSKTTDRKEKTSREVENERMRREREMENERLRRMEEEREREREREKDRMAVDLATLEARERASGESRERAERIAVERATTEARQRAMTVARERLEKACAEAREKSLAGKTSTEARLRAERAAVERATVEARDRAAERAALEAKDRVQRSVSDKFSGTARNNGMRQSSSSSDLQDSQNQNSKVPKYEYSSVYGERNDVGEPDSAQRCKAIFERHRRTSERAAKALAEKNMRDLQTQREQAERNRLAETLDADVKRWSNGKEGNLRALLSTLQYILGSEGGWQPIPLTEVITSAAVKKAYRKATLCVHPDKLQQRGASIQQKYICEKVFDLLKEAWSKFNSEER